MKLKNGFIVLILVLTLSLIGAASFSAEGLSGTCGDSSVTYEITSDQGLVIGGSGEMPDYTDTERPWDAYASSILRFEIGDGITSIGAYAFINVNVGVIIPDSVTSIGEYALGYEFDGEAYTLMPGFTITGATGSAAEDYAEENGITFKPTSLPVLEGSCGSGVSYRLTPAGVLTISGNGQMYHFTSSNAPWQSYKSGTGDYIIKEIVIENGVTHIGDGAFSDCTSLTKVTMSSVTAIGNSAFEDCTALTEITLPTTLETIGGNAFSYTSALKAINIPDSVSTIGTKAFSQSGIESVTLPESLTTVGETAFYGCESLTDAIVNTVNIPSRVFAECTALENVTLTDTVETIGESAFENCTALVNFTSTSSLKSVGPYAFEGCSALFDIRFEESVTEFGFYAFKNCTSLSAFSFTDAVTAIPEGMFYGCTSLASVNLGDGITAIGDYAFVDCRSLNTIFISYKVRTFGLYALGYTFSNESYVKIPGHELEIEGFTPSAAKEYAADNGITFTHYKTVDTDRGSITDTITWIFRPSTGVLNIMGSGNMPDYLSFDETPWHIYQTYIKQVTFSTGIMNIGSSSFEGCSSIEKIDIPGTVQVIGSHAFAGTSIISANIPTGVREISNSAFEGCSSLYTVTLPNTLTKIDEGAFRGPNIMVSIFVPQSVTEIGANAIGFHTNNTPVSGFVIKGIEGSIANTYADLNGISFLVNGYVEITDDEDDCTVSILGDNAYGYKLDFSKIPSVFNPTLLIPSDQTILQYQIKLTYNDQSAKLDGSVDISFPIPEGIANKMFKLYYVGSDGAFIPVEFENKNGKIVFSYTSLGKFVISTADLSKLYTITVNYLYSDGTVQKAPVIAYATSGAQYRFTAENLKGYTLNEYAFAGTVTDSNIVIEFTYTKSTGIPVETEKPEKKGDGAGTKFILTILLIILIIALIAAVILFFYLTGKKKKQEKETGRTINAAAKKKPITPGAMEKTIVVPDFATREIDIESLFADDPEEDLEAEEELRKKSETNNE